MLQQGNIIYLDPTVAEAEGLDVEKLVLYYKLDGIKLVTKRPQFVEGENRWMCYGCMRAWERNDETWRRSTIDPSVEWQPLCRECEGTTLNPALADQRARNRARFGKPVRKKPGKQIPDELRQPTRHLPPGQGHAARWRFDR